MEIDDLVVIFRGYPSPRTGIVVGKKDNHEAQGVCEMCDMIVTQSDNHLGYDTSLDRLKEILGISSDATVIYWIDIDSSGKHHPVSSDAVRKATPEEELEYNLEK